MKFISFKDNISAENALIECEPRMYCIPDTALHINKRPFFIPPFAVPCVMQLRWAIRIVRLGRNISARFATRYYDAATLCAHFAAPALPPSQGLCFDDCLTVGEWQNHTLVSTETACRAIEEVSKFYTLRQGDILLLEPHGNVKEVKIGEHVEVENYLNFNIK